MSSNFRDHSDVIRDLLDDGDESESDGLFGDDSDLDPDFVFEDEESDDEISANVVSADNVVEDESAEVVQPAESSGGEDRQRNRHLLQGRNKKNPYIWSSIEPERRGRHPERNLVKHLPGPKGAAKEVRTPENAWNLLIDDAMITEITVRTNDEIHRKIENINEKYSFHRTTTNGEILAYIGLLYLAGVHRDSRRNLEDLWSQDLGFSIYRATMSLNRFYFISSCLRFDDKTTRLERAKDDPLAAIRYIWDSFVDHCKMYYTPFEHCTIDEQLMGFRGRCRFRVYIKSKPDRYGLKVVMLNDSKTSYMLNAIPYTGQVKTDNKEPIPTYYVRNLSQPIHGTNRNITTDNWFTSVPMFNMMLVDYKLTMVGTMRANKTEIPAKFLAAKSKGESLFAFDHNKTLVSYTPKENKNVILLSTLHRSAIVDNETKKPEIILFYNSTKGGTDTFDKLCHTYSVSRKTKRWPLRYFFGILDQCGVNSMILYSLNMDNPRLRRRKYLETLAKNLIKPWLHERMQVPTIQRGIKVAIREILQLPLGNELEEDGEAVRKQRCAFCPRVKDRKTKVRCSSCRAAMCDDHRAKICKDCAL